MCSPSSTSRAGFGLPSAPSICCSMSMNARFGCFAQYWFTMAFADLMVSIHFHRRNAWLDRDEHDPSLRQRGVHLLVEQRELMGDLLSRDVLVCGHRIR